MSCIMCIVTMVIFSLGYEGEEVPGEVKALEINPVMPQQVCYGVLNNLCIFRDE